MPLTQVSPGLLDTTAQYYGFKNRIINGDMRIDQRNNGASVTPADGQYLVDRFQFYRSSGTFSAQRSTTAPTGFSNSLQFTVSSSATRNAADYCFFQQNIEGFNIADLALGTSSASAFTISFWVRSSAAGLYSGCCNSSDNTRTFPFTFTINSANTFELKTVTIPGDTTGTWATTNGIGMYVRFDLGSGSNYQSTAGAGWQALTNKIGVAGTVSWAQTNGATFYITGVQLEKGSTATSFDYRPYGTELVLCQRYYQLWLAGWSGVSGGAGYQITSSTTFSVQMRATPTLGVSSQSNSARYPSSSYFVTNQTSIGTVAGYVAQSSGGNEGWFVNGTASAEL